MYFKHSSRTSASTRVAKLFYGQLAADIAVTTGTFPIEHLLRYKTRHFRT